MEDWIHVNPNSGQGNNTVEITVDANESSEDRQGSVDIRTSTLNKILNIIQKGAEDMANVIAFYLSNEDGTNAQVYCNNVQNNFPAMYSTLRSEVQTPESGKFFINPYLVYIIITNSSTELTVYKAINCRITDTSIIFDACISNPSLITNEPKLVQYKFTASGIKLTDTDMYTVTLSSYTTNKLDVMGLVASRLNTDLKEIKHYFDDSLPIPVMGEDNAQGLAEAIETSYPDITCEVIKA